MQVGPLAQVLVGYAGGHEPIRSAGPTTCSAPPASIARTKIPPTALHSTLGRHVARAVRAAVLGELAAKHWQLLVDNIGKGDTDIFDAAGVPRRASSAASASTRRPAARCRTGW